MTVLLNDLKFALPFRPLANLLIGLQFYWWWAWRVFRPSARSSSGCLDSRGETWHDPASWSRPFREVNICLFLTISAQTVEFRTLRFRFLTLMTFPCIS